MSELVPVDVAATPEEKFREYLRTKGKRLTTERETIVREIFADHEHFDPEQLIVRMKGVEKSASRASVYRTLTLLEEAGLIRKVARANDREVYEHDYGYPQHDHLICKKCGDLIEFHNDEIAQIIARIATERGFRMSGHRLEVHGTCEACSRPPKRNHKLGMI